MWAAAPNDKKALLAKALAGVIRRRREALHLSLEEFAARIGLRRQTLGFLEDDQRSPTLKTLLRIARGFDIRLGQLITEAEEWLNAQPDCCKKCYFCCLHRGELPWLNDQRVCTRPKHWKP